MNISLKLNELLFYKYTDKNFSLSPAYLDCDKLV
jgi:hypothetical protein